MRVEIDLSKIKRNLGRIAERTGKELIPMLKADAYGHGALRVASAIGAPYYGVATEEEGIPLRELSKEVLVTAPSLFSVPLLRRFDMIPLIGSFELARLAAEGRLKRCHIKVNSGMNRLGFSGEKECYAAAALLTAAGVRIEGIATHYKEDDKRNLLSQNRAFDGCVFAVRQGAAAKGGENKIFTHVTASGASLAGKYDFLRVGLAAYGYSSSAFTAALALEPAMRVTTEIIKVKELRAGETLGYAGIYRASRPLKAYTFLGGYGDGIARAEVGRRVLTAGGRGRIVAVCMDSSEMIADRIDLSVGARVIILSEGADAAYIAAHRKTIPYEVLLGYDVPRAERIYAE